MSKRTKAYEPVIEKCGFGIPSQYSEGDMSHTYLNTLNITSQELAKHKKEIVDGVEDAYRKAMIDFANDIDDVSVECQQVHNQRVINGTIVPVMDALHETLNDAYENGLKVKSDLWHDIYRAMGLVLASATTSKEYAIALYGKRCSLVIENSERFKTSPQPKWQPSRNGDATHKATEGSRPHTELGKLGWQPKIKNQDGFKTELGDGLRHLAEMVGVKMFDRLIYNVGPKMWGGDDDDDE